MPNLTIFLKNTSSLKPTIFINDKEVRIKKKNGKQVCSINCDSHVKLRIENYHPLNQKFGMLIAYFFFIISLLGIFDLRYHAKAKRLLFSAELDLVEDTELEIKYNSYSKDKEALELQGDASYRILTNQYILDDKLKKKIKILNFLKFITWVVFIVVFAYLMFHLIVN